MEMQSFIHLQIRRYALIIIALNPLSKDLTQNWWIKHPRQLLKRPTKNRFKIRIPAFTVFVNHRGTDWEPKKKPQLRVLLALTHCFAATQSTFSLLMEKANIMVYKFLIAGRNAKLAKLNSIRIVKVHAENEFSARAMYSGIPLIFLSCIPEGMPA